MWWTLEMPPGESVVLKSCIAEEGCFDYLGNPASSVFFCMALPRGEALGWGITQRNLALTTTYEQSRETENGLCRACKLTEYTSVYAFLPWYPSSGQENIWSVLGLARETAA